MNHRQGALVAFEGIDGAGKSTQIQALRTWLQGQGHEVVTSREPTQGVHGTALRRSMQEGRLDPAQELALFLADRRDHVTSLIQPSMEEGKVVLLDRYYFSTIAYQGARGHDPAKLRADNESFAPAPDLLLIFDLSPQESLRRIRHSRGSAPDSFEVPELLARSRQIFLDLAADLPYAVVIDATATPEEVTRQVLHAAQHCAALSTTGRGA